jgi:hypothetical protein
MQKNCCYLVCVTTLSNYKVKWRNDKSDRQIRRRVARRETDWAYSKGLKLTYSRGHMTLNAHNRSKLGRLRILSDWLIMMGWDYVSELPPPAGLLFIFRVICEHGVPWWWWCRLGITPDSSTRAIRQSYQQRRRGQVGGMDEGVRILPVSIWHTLRDL